MHAARSVDGGDDRVWCLDERDRTAYGRERPGYTPPDLQRVREAVQADEARRAVAISGNAQPVRAGVEVCDGERHAVTKPRARESSIEQPVLRCGGAAGGG